MARAINRLSARSAATIAAPGRHADGQGLYLVVDPSGARRWLFMFRWEGKLKEMGLGSLNAVSLANARQLASEARTVVASGRNPINTRRQATAERHARLTFGEFADALVKELANGFRNTKHAAQWEMTLRVYALPLRSMKLDEIRTEDVLTVLRPIWTTKAETASRVRGRIERVLDAAKAKGLRTGENPARWRSHLDQLLPQRRKLQRGHHPAMPYSSVPVLMNALRERCAVSALALQFLILTAARAGEVFGAKWSEIDLDARLWTVPAIRMKAGREHRVPLSQPACDILKEVKSLQADAGFVFPGLRRDRPLSNMAFSALLKRMKIEGITAHGFRSSFRDWAGEATSHPREVAEAALAHVVGDQTERAYRRGDALAKRRALMDEWSNFIASANNAPEFKEIDR